MSQTSLKFDVTFAQAAIEPETVEFELHIVKLPSVAVAVTFARALVSEADILILDEPTSSLDLRHQVLVLDRIKRLSCEDGFTVLFTTHHPHHALAVADEVLLMLGREESRCGPASEVLTEENLRALYGVDVKRVAFEHNGKVVETFAPVIALETRADGIGG